MGKPFTALLTIPPMNLLRLWSDLDDAYYGKNGYGGDTAELYSYRFNSRQPGLEALAPGPGREKYEREAGLEAATALFDLLWLFEQERNCKVRVHVGRDHDGVPLRKFDRSEPFTHRIHVRVLRPTKPPQEEP